MRVSGSQRYILDYLTEEVLRRQPPEVQTFLLRTSVLERLSASLCEAVTQLKGSQKLLEFLERSNVFVVPLDGQRHWYRYHALFAEALRLRLEQTEGEALSALHLRASKWYAEQGFFSEAVLHAISARDWPQAADLIEQEYAFIWGSNEHALVRRWLEKLPLEIMRSRPRLCLAYAKTLFMVAPYETIARWLRHAERALRATVETPTEETAATRALPPSARQEWDNLLGETAAYSAIITGYYLGEGTATLAFCQQALAHLSEQHLIARAEVAYAKSVPLAVGLPHAMVSSAYIFHAEVLRQWNRLDEALSLALQAVQLSEQTETIVTLYIGYTELMRVYLARGELEAARSALQQAEATLAKTYYNPYRRDVYVIVDWVQFWLASGAMDRASRWAEELAQSARVPSSLACDRQDVALEPHGSRATSAVS